MDSIRLLKMCCVIWQQDVNSRSFKWRQATRLKRFCVTACNLSYQATWLGSLLGSLWFSFCLTCQLHLLHSTQLSFLSIPSSDGVLKMNGMFYLVYVHNFLSHALCSVLNSCAVLWHLALRFYFVTPGSDTVHLQPVLPHSNRSVSRGICPLLRLAFQNSPH